MVVQHPAQHTAVGMAAQGIELNHSADIFTSKAHLMTVSTSALHSTKDRSVLTCGKG